MRFLPGQSGNPAGRPPGALSKKTLAVEAAIAEYAGEVVVGLRDRAMNGETTAVRMFLDRAMPTGGNRPFAFGLPVIKSADDAETALAIVTDELAAGNLTINEATALVALVDRMLRVAERAWNFRRTRRYAEARDAILLGSADENTRQADDRQAEQDEAPEAPQTPEKPAAPLYSPVNSGIPAAAEEAGATTGREGEAPESTAPPLPRAA